MTDIKISQLSSTSTLNNTDLFPISKDIGGGNWESKSISGINLLKGLTTERSLMVSKEGAADATTIKDAVALAVAMNPTQLSPVTIQVMSGTYAEDNPINIPQWVTIYSAGGTYSATVIANNNGNIFVGNGNSQLNGFTVIGGVSFSNVAYVSTSSATGEIKNCILMNCETGVLSDNGSIIATFINSLSMQRVFNKVLSAVNGGFLAATSCGVTVIMTKPVYCFYSSDVGSELYLFSCICSNSVNGLYATNDGYIDCLSCHFEDCDNAIHIGSAGSSHVKSMGTIIEDSVINDVFIESTTARLAFMGHLDSSKFSIISGAEVNIIADDENTVGGLIVGKSSLQGKMSVGTPGAASLGLDQQVNIGEGSAFVNDAQGNSIVEYWSYNASAPSGSRFTRFANNAGTQLANSNDAIIVGCKYPFPAIRLDIDVAMVTANYIATEYWNGTTWVDLTAQFPGGGVAGYKRSDFTRRANQIFRNVETQFVEVSLAIFDNGDWADDINVLNEIPDWDANESFYAIRFRNNGVLTTPMTFANGMVKPHSFMFSTSGKQANFGIYRTDRSLYIDSSGFAEDVTNPPSYSTIQVSPNISYGRVPVCLKANAISQVSVAFTMPYDIDTSSPLRCYVDGTAIQAGGGDLLTTIYIARIDSNNPPLNMPITDIEIGPQVTSIPNLTNGFATVYQEIDVSGMASDDLLFLSFARLAGDSADTYAGDFILGDITFRYHAKFV